MSDKVTLVTDEKVLMSIDGAEHIMHRSWGKTQNGNPLAGRWALYKVSTGEIVDFDAYRNDLLDRIGLSWPTPIR